MSSKRQKRLKNNRPLNEEQKKGADYMIAMLAKNVKTKEDMERLLRQIPSQNQRDKVRALLETKISFMIPAAEAVMN